MHVIIRNIEKYSLREGTEAWGDGGEMGTRDRGQVRVGTRFARNKDEVSFLPVRCRDLDGCL